MIQRSSQKKLKQLAAAFRCVAVTGPRQSGKTTLCKITFPKKPYVSLENIDDREFAENDPRGFLAQFKNGAILDEVQKVPVLFSYLQQVLDETKKTGLFILSGSNNFLLQENISQTLAGRIAYIHLLPLSIDELKQNNLFKKDVNGLLHKGLYPELYNRKNISSNDWYANYLNTYIERDVRQLKNIGNLSLFTKFLKLCANRTGQILNMASIANDCGIDTKTVLSWLSILESSYVVYLLKPYFNNMNKRLIKSPKIYFYDTGIVCALLDIENSKQVINHALKGGLFENLILMELLKERLNAGKQDNLYYWRDKTGNEVDILFEEKNKINLIEVKSGITISSEYFKGLTAVGKAIGEKNIKSRTVIYGGNQQQVRKNNEIIKSWSL
jgi:predicted AAA+ superfamily ATPase